MTQPEAPSPVTVSPEAFLALGREVPGRQAFSRLLGAGLAARLPDNEGPIA